MYGDRRARVRKALIGFFALLLIAQFARTMAADLIPADPVAVVDAPSAAPAPSDSAAPSPEPSPTDVAPTPTVEPTPIDSAAPSASPSPTPIAPHALSVYLPQIAAYGPANLLVCVSSGQVAFDIAGQNQTDPKLGTLIAGDRTSFVRASGIGSAAIGAVNSSNGLRAISLSQGISNTFITFSFVALSEPSLSPALCNAGSASNTRTISIQGIGLNIDMAGGNVTLKR